MIEGGAANPFALSLSKGLLASSQGFDKLSPNGQTASAAAARASCDSFFTSASKRSAGVLP
ncbi:hypothetical protein SAMN02787076_01752 [Rhizobacter sp. OV335]|nr:hypothetical protein SAMN02787076_01752 [Rhizobacter sp. OV335]